MTLHIILGSIGLLAAVVVIAAACLKTHVACNPAAEGGKE